MGKRLRGIVPSAACVAALALLPSTHPSAPILRAHRRALVVAADDAVANAAGADEDDNIFTMKRRNDGWDDVRDSIDTANKDRSKAIGSLNEWSEKYVAPAGRWAKVLAEELPVLDGVKSVELPPLPTLPAPSSPAPKAAKAAPTPTPIANAPPPTAAATVSLKERAFTATATLLDAAAKQRCTFVWCCAVYEEGADRMIFY